MDLNLEARCREQFKRMLASGQGHPIHTPAPSGRVTSAWSSGFHALALRHLDARLAIQELESLYALGQGANGLLADAVLLPHTAGSAAADVDLEPTAPGFENGRSRFIAPPVAAFAVGVLAQDRKLDLTALLECATRELDAIWAERLPPDTPLPVILHPREAGLRRNPLFSDLIDSDDDEEWEAELASLARSALACRLDPATALRAGHAFVLEDPCFCGWLLVALEELEVAWEARGQSATALKLRVRSTMIREAIEERLWWEDQEIYTAFNRGRQAPVHTISASGLVPAAVRGLIEEGSAKRAIDRHLRPSGSPLWSARGLVLEPLAPGVRDEATLSPGHVVVPAVQYAAHLALVRSGRLSDARVLRQQLETALEAQEFADAYSPITGAPAADAQLGSAGPALLLDMRARDESA
jgi:hypothetical protein